MTTHPMNTALSERLVEAWLEQRPLSTAQALALAPPSHADAYRVQQAVGAALGWFDSAGPRFWKLGGQPGSSLASVIAPRLIHTLPSGTLPQLASDDACTFTALEVELTVRLGRELPPGATLDEAREAVAEVYLTVEVCDLRAAALQQLPSTYRLADQQVNRGFVLLGTPQQGWQETLAEIAPRLSLNGRCLSDATLRHPQGHPLAPLPWLANLSGALFAEPLAAGSLIATGAWSGMHMLDAGDRFAIELAGFAPCSIALDGPAAGFTPLRFGNGVA